MQIGGKIFIAFVCAKVCVTTSYMVSEETLADVGVS